MTFTYSLASTSGIIPPMERIQKFLASRGAGSRRQIDALLQQGRISVNGKTAHPGDQVNGREKIAIDGKLLRLQRHAARHKILMYHKPVGLVCTRADPEGREDVFRHLPRLQQGRWVSVGRLDINTSGLLLFTNDGELANRLMHPSGEIERVYAVRVLGEVGDDMLGRLRQGVQLDDGMAAFTDIRDAGGTGANHWYHVTLREGRNREVRRMWESQGVQVSRLMRVSFGPISLPRQLRPGKYRELTRQETVALYRSVGLQAPPPPRKHVSDKAYRKRARKSL